MANAILIVGDTGSGKSTSLENLDPKETSIINVVGKALPFRGWKKKYKKKGETAPGELPNLFDTDNYEQIHSVLEKLNRIETVKNIVIDDGQYLMSGEFMARAKERGYDKFTEIGLHVWELLDHVRKMRPDINFYILAHDESVMDASGEAQVRKMKTIGKLLDDKVTLEGLFTVVLFTEVKISDEGNKYFFRTQTDGVCRAKSPRGMFDDILIPNDLQFVSEKIREYDEG